MRSDISVNVPKSLVGCSKSRNCNDMQLFNCSYNVFVCFFLVFSDASSPFSSKNVLPGIKKASKGHDATSDGEVLRICIRYEDIKANVIKEKRKV